MKRSNFLATIAAVFLAPFVKAKPKFEREFSPELIFDKEFDTKYTQLSPADISVDDDLPFEIDFSFKEIPPDWGLQVGDRELSFPFPKGYPNDGKEHDMHIRYDCNKVQYFIDGKQVLNDLVEVARPSDEYLSKLPHDPDFILNFKADSKGNILNPDGTLHTWVSE